jgi:hypothetical protein
MYKEISLRIDYFRPTRTFLVVKQQSFIYPSFKQRKKWAAENCPLFARYIFMVPHEEPNA